MKSALVASSLFTSTLGAALAPSFDTLTIPIPSQGTAFTSTVSACGTVNGFAIVGVPNGTLVAGTQTVFIPPQASATSSTFIDEALSATEVVQLVPLQGSCAPFDFSTSSAFTDLSQFTATGTSGGATPTASGDCPLGTVASAVNGAAQEVIDAINQVTLLSQNLQAAAKQIGTGFGTSAILKVVNGLSSIVSTLTTVIPRISSLPPFVKRQDEPSPTDDATDAIVIALISFVRVHQALLNIIIGRRGLLSGFPFGDDTAQQLAAIAQGSADDVSGLLAALGRQGVDGVVVAERAAAVNPVTAPIAGVLRSVETVVDQLAFAIIGLIPRREACAKQQKVEIDGTLDEAVKAYEN
ncbi:hypothetical protein UCRNP2_5693 [Neofusicoccum parvum UCRNP2]|uniref:Uncharacterized protein n=1 Tax=Botryosphaeria parva (strain UCR-NP2) TaxID=1287680 RepID=R1EJ75_BOTPV|nr:hypothetical protein UCRNP2_5693 [Neofusicoccum parvum UCRNP2]